MKKHGLRFAMVLAALTGLTRAAGARIESHCLPPEMSAAMFPSWVSTLPKIECREVSAPLVHEKVEERKVVVDEDEVNRLLGLKPRREGKPDARNLSDMCKEPRAAIRLAESQKYKEAAAAGDALLNLPGDRYGDFTWDYLANATAWAHIQSGDLKAAVWAHNAAAARIDDIAVVQYHRIAATVLNETVKSPRQMKDYATYTAEIRESLADRVKRFNQSSVLAQKTRSAEARLRHLKAAYGELRVLTATDPSIGERLTRTTFREAADGLVAEIAPVLLDEAQQVRDEMVALYPQILPGRKFHVWNTKIQTLWELVRRVKRLCRMHDYLARTKLASHGDAARVFRQAHRLLFTPSNPKLVWQMMGNRPVHYKDYRRKVPYKQTAIKPMH